MRDMPGWEVWSGDKVHEAGRIDSADCLMDTGFKLKFIGGISFFDNNDVHMHNENSVLGGRAAD